MPCDERYRSWAMRRVPPPPSPELCRALLVRVCDCPARRGFRELHFDVEGTAWSWCFPEAAEPYSRAAGPAAGNLVLRPGPYGLIAETVTSEAGEPPGSAGLDLAVAADLAMAATPVFVHRCLIGRARGEAAPAARPPGAMAAVLHQQGAQ